MNLPFSLRATAPGEPVPFWDGNQFVIGDTKTPILEYNENFSGWNDELTELHESEGGNMHPIDVASRNNAIQQLLAYLPDKENASILEIGCSSGYLLREMRTVFPSATIIGSDVVRTPLYNLAKTLPATPLFRFDLLQCPLPDSMFDSIICLNVLEHIEDDHNALKQIHRLLKPNGFAIIEVPSGKCLYDKIDEALQHFRRYGLRNLVTTLSNCGFAIPFRSHLGFFAYLPFAFIKIMNKFFARNHDAEHSMELLRKDVRQTRESKLMGLFFSIEAFLGKYVQWPFGIRCIVVASKKVYDKTQIHTTK